MELTSISQKSIHPLAIETCRILQEQGYEAYIVGGCVRDLLLGVAPKDWDITTNASPQSVINLFPRTIPTGLQHGTVTVCMGEGVENHFEVTTFRIEGEYKDGRRPEEVFFVAEVEKDLARRDLTINAIAYDPIRNRLVDPYDGIADLENEMIKAVGEANLRFQEDGLRIMRVARFAARFGYAVDGATFEGMKANLETLQKVSRERITDELSKTLMTKSPSYGLQLLLKSGALDIACPLLAGRQLPLLDQQDQCEGELETRLAFLYNKINPDLVHGEMINLKFASKQTKKVVFLLSLVERFNLFLEQDSILAYRSFMAVLKNHSIDPWHNTLQQFIMLAEAMGIDAYGSLYKYRNETVFSKKEMLLNGDDLLEAGMKAGPRIKQALEACYLEILRNPESNTKYRLLEVARQF